MSSTLPETPVEPKESARAWQAPAEAAPSQVSAPEPTLARWTGFAALVLTSLGIAMLILYNKGNTGALLGFFGPVFTVFGVAGLLFHAANDPDLQYRRSYGVLGFGLLALGLLASLLPAKGQVGASFLPYGVPALTLGLLFLMPFVHHETEAKWRHAALFAVGGLGFLMAAAGFIGGNVSENFLLPYSLVLTTLGFCFLWAFAVLQGSENELGYRAALAIGLLGTLGFVVAVGRSVVPPLTHALHWSFRPAPYFVPSGLLLMAGGLVYMALSIGLTSDNRVVVLARRELAGIFYSPIAYIVFCGMVVVGWALFDQFIRFALLPRPGTFTQTQELAEPILFSYIISWWPIICMILVVPVITMRTFAEEKRSGTLEVLLTAPVSENAVVIGKFLATFIFFMLAVLPWGLYLVSLRIEGGQPFEYRPLLSFFVALACSGAGFLAMGLFFSSLTRNQIASALLTAVGMIGWTIVFFIAQSESVSGSFWSTVLNHVSYIHLWWSSMEGMIVPPMLVFHVSAAVFWLFLTVKVLEARKWV